MIAKWIVCHVTDREAFAKAQQAWSRCSDAEGFLGQTGGFHGRDACVLSLWESRASLDAFMADEHDVILGETRQDLTYDKITVEVLPIVAVGDVVDALLECAVLDAGVFNPKDPRRVIVEPSWRVRPRLASRLEQ